MEDGQPVPCCENNKQYKIVIFKRYKTKPTGFFILCRGKGSRINREHIMVKCCPFCAKDIERLNILI